MKRTTRRQQALLDLAHTLQAGKGDGRISTVDSDALHEAVYAGERSDEVDSVVRRIYRDSNFTGPGRTNFERRNRSEGARRAWQVRRAQGNAALKHDYYVRVGGVDLDFALLSAFGMAAPGGRDYMVSEKEVTGRIADRLRDGGRITDRELATVEHALAHKRFSRPAIDELEKIVTEVRGEPVLDWDRIRDAQERFRFPRVLQHSAVRNLSSAQMAAYEKAAFAIAAKEIEDPQVQRIEFASDNQGRPTILFAFQNDQGASLLLRLDHEMKESWRSGDHKRSADAPKFPSIPRVSEVKLSLAEAYEKAIEAAPHAVWNNSSLIVDRDSGLRFGFWHVSNWLEQPSVSVDAQTGKVEVTDNRKELLKQIEQSGIDVDKHDWRPYGITADVVKMWQSLY